MDVPGIAIDEWEKYMEVLPPRKEGGPSSCKCLYPRCSSESSRICDFKRHWRIHFSKAQMACDFPGCKVGGFVQLSNLEEHKRKVHDQKDTLLCGFCDAEFVDSSRLSRHRNDEHKGEHVKGAHTEVGKERRKARRQAREEIAKGRDDDQEPMKAPSIKRLSRKRPASSNNEGSLQRHAPVANEEPMEASPAKRQSRKRPASSKHEEETQRKAPRQSLSRPPIAANLLLRL
ncbi:hypothetical protein K474DRAFT_702997 [Panus rudis PR-1116 ss-1]|nr:hypothetical protein K474DRAFT_702997 [Panus rudis PR-1116 ss-1]